MLEISYFNPVVEDWTEECQREEERQKEICDYHLYVITPRMAGFFSIAEVVDSSNKNPKGTILCVLKEDMGNLPRTTVSFGKAPLKSLDAVKHMVLTNGAYVFDNLEAVAELLNTSIMENNVKEITSGTIKTHMTDNLIEALRGI